MTDDRLADYLDHIRDAARLARSYVENMSREEFLADTRTQQAVILNLEIVWETVGTSLPELLSQLSSLASHTSLR